MLKNAFRGFAFGVGGSVAVVFFTVVAIIIIPRRSVAQLGVSVRMAGTGGEAMDCAQVPFDEFVFSTSTVNNNGVYGLDSGLDAEGNFVVTWQNKEWPGQIYAQRMDKYGNKIGDVILVGDLNSDTLIQYGPKIAVAAGGNFTIAWFYADRTDSSYGVFIQRFDQAGSALGSRISIVDPYVVASPEIAVDNLGNFIVAWYDWDQIARRYTVKVQRFGSGGNKIGGVIVVSTWTNDFLDSYYREIRLAIDQERNFSVVWNQGMVAVTDYHPDIYFQKFNSSGVKIGSAVKVASGVKEDISVNAIAANTNGELIVTWRKYYDSMANPVEYHIFAKKYGADNRPAGEAFQIDRVYTHYAMGSKIGFDGAGNFTIAWYADNCEYGICADEIIAQKFDASLNRIGQEYVVNGQSNGVIGMDLATNDAGNTLFILSDEGGPTIKAKIMCPGHCTDTFRDGGEQAVDCGGECQNSCPLQCPLTFRSASLLPNGPTQDYIEGQVVKQSINGEFIMAWNQGGKIMARITDRNGTTIRAPFLIEEASNHAMLPFDLDVSPDGSWMVVWTWSANSDVSTSLYARRFDGRGNALSPRTLVTTHGSHLTMQSIDVGADQEGNYVVTWNDWYSAQVSYDHRDIFVQRINGSGEKIGAEVVVNSDPAWPYNDNPAIVMLPEGQFTVVWHGRNKDSTMVQIFAQLFDRTGEKNGAQLLVKEGTTEILPGGCSVASDADGNMLVAWTRYKKIPVGWQPTDIYLQRFTSQWAPIGEEQKVNHLTRGTQDRVTVALNAIGYSAVIWRNIENTSYPRVMMKRFDNQGFALGAETAIDESRIADNGGRSGLAINDDGDIAVIWNQGKTDFGDSGVFYRVFLQGCRNCSDGEKNFSETDVDCGGFCGPCGNGKSCAVHNDCVSAICNASNICAVPSCSDGVQNGSETGVDCGGSCPECPCIPQWTCTDWGACANGRQSRTCTDTNACGSTSGKPAEGQDCPLCHDNIRNQDEVRIDCGGACTPCHDKCLPLVLKGSSDKKIDLLFIPDDRYGSDLNANVRHDDGSQSSFKFDVMSKLIDFKSVPPISVLADNFNIYYSQDVADADAFASDDPKVRAQTFFGNEMGYATSCPQIDAYAILHPNTLDDLTTGSVFSAEGNLTKAFLHESGHAIFGLYDEYNSAPTCYTNYDQGTTTSNIWHTEGYCWAEGNFTGLWKPADCRRFTTCQNGFWKMSGNTDNIMVRGLPTDTFDAASYHRVQWVFEQTVSRFRPAGNYGVNFESGAPPKTVVVTYAMNGNQLQAVATTAVEDYAPNYAGSDGPLSFTISNSSGAAFEKFSLPDPRIVLREDNGSGPPIVLQNATFTVAFPYYPTLKSATIVHEEEPALTVTTDLGRALGNICATKPGDPDCQAADVDGDGISGETDNCPTIANPDQLDSNSNGAGDACEPFRRGDANGSGVIDISDPVYILTHLFLGTASPPQCMDALDANDDSGLDVSDAVFTLTWLFIGGEKPPAPGPVTPGPDPTEDILQCQQYP